MGLSRRYGTLRRAIKLQDAGAGEFCGPGNQPATRFPSTVALHENCLRSRWGPAQRRSPERLGEVTRRHRTLPQTPAALTHRAKHRRLLYILPKQHQAFWSFRTVRIYSLRTCLLYTSDAADDLLCVDLGGRRIIKNKKKK